MEIQISTLKAKIDEILSILETVQPSVDIPNDHWCYWHLIGLDRYRCKKPELSMLSQGDLRDDWDDINAVPPARPLLIQLSNLLRVIGDDPDWHKLKKCDSQ
jgi:hypothetical protein